MNYNEYDSNGNRKKFNFADIITNKTQRSRLLLLIYLIIFIVLIVFIRLNISSSLNNNEIIKKEEKENNNQEKNINTETNIVLTDDMFSFIDLDNYNFTYNIDFNNSISLIEGKRFNDKYYFTMTNNGSILYFNGTSNYIKAKETLDGEYKITGFPYVLVNIFNTNIIKDLINNSTINNDKYEITNKKVGEISNYNKMTNVDAINTIELVKSNNKITQINIDLSNAISSYMNENVKAIITLKYSNFGLIDDFKIE